MDSKVVVVVDEPVWLFVVDHKTLRVGVSEGREEKAAETCACVIFFLASLLLRRGGARGRLASAARWGRLGGVG